MSLINTLSHRTVLRAVISMGYMEWFGGLVLIIKWLSQFQSFAGKQQQKGQREQGAELISDD